MPQLMYRAKKIELLHIDISTNLISQLKKNTLNCYQVNLDFTIQSRSIGGGGGGVGRGVIMELYTLFHFYGTCKKLKRN